MKILVGSDDTGDVVDAVVSELRRRGPRRAAARRRRWRARALGRRRAKRRP